METNGDYRGGFNPQGENRHQMSQRHHPSSNRAIIGVVLVLAGLFLVLKNTGFFPDFIDEVIFSWPMLLITIGLVMTLSASEKTGGIIVMAVGGFFMIPLLFKETFHMYNMFWPSIFIIIGVIFIVTRRKGLSSVKPEGVSGDDYIDYVNIFSGDKRQIISQNFKGGKITAIFGGTELDLTKADLAAGVSEIEIACIFGGATIIIPDDWYVTIDVTPVLGGFSDTRKLVPGRPVDSTKHLVIKGTVIFGGGELKSY